MAKDKTIFINPLTDYGFKRLFGTIENKDILISFLNSLFYPHIHITDVTFRDKEHVGEIKEDRTMIYDIFCTTDGGEHLIVEMQNRYQAYFKDRVVYYQSKGFVRQGQKGSEWDYHLDPVYGIYITNFVNPLFDDEQMVEEVCLINVRSHEVFSEKMRMFFLKIPEMKKEAEECDTLLQMWMYTLKNLENMRDLPEIFLKEPVFRQLDRVARYAALSREEQDRYDRSLKTYRDTLAILNTERSEGVKEGIEKGIQQGIQQGILEGREQGILENKIALIRTMAAKGYPFEAIEDLVELPKNQILDILNCN